MAFFAEKVKKIRGGNHFLRVYELSNFLFAKLVQLKYAAANQALHWARRFRYAVVRARYGCRQRNAAV